MATSVGRIYLSGCNYELAYDLLSQSSENNTSNVRLYGILHVTNNYISWSSGTASIHTESAGIGTYYSKGDYVVIQRDFTWAHDANGNFSATIGYGLTTTFVSGSSSGVITLPKINRFATITETPSSLTDEGTPYIKFTNPGNATNLNVWLEVNPNGAHYATRNLSITSGTYTWELTEAERNQLRAVIPNSNKATIRLGLYSTQGSSSGASYKDIPFSIVNANPTFTNFEFEDANNTTKTLTGSTTNNVIHVAGYSNIKATISTSNKAVANKQATMSKYQFQIGTGTPIDIAYSSSASVNGTINKATSGTYKVIAFDSRGNTTTVTKQATSVKNYTNLSINKQNCSFLRDNNQVADTATLTLSGTFWHSNFGATTNSIKSVTYRFKKTTSSSWTTGTTQITSDVQVSGNNFSYSGNIAGDTSTKWDLASSYDIQVTISDKLSSDTVTFTLNSAIPTLSLDKEGVGVLCSYDSNIGGKLQVDGKIIDGGTVLWKNPDSTIDFPQQDITLNSSDYDVLEIYYRSAKGNNYMLHKKTLKGYSTILLSGTIATSPYVQRRYFDYVNDTTYNVKGMEGAWGGDQGNLIPVYIIGYKTNLFS